MKVKYIYHFRCIQVLLWVGILLSTFNVQAVQLTNIKGKLECLDISDFFQCIAKIENNLLAGNKEIVTRDAKSITVTLLDGNKRIIVTENKSVSVLELTKNKRFLTFQTIEEQDTYWEIYDRLIGKLISIPAYPYFSPDESKLVASYSELQSIYPPILIIYTISKSEIKEIFKGKKEDLNNVDPAWRY